MENDNLPAAAVSRPPCECWLIEGAKALDPIHVFWMDSDPPGRGYVTIICYGQSWTAYFGGMSGKTIREFFASCDTGYLLSKLGIGPHLKSTRRDQEYLRLIVEAVRESLAQGRGLATAGGNTESGGVLPKGDKRC